MTLAALLLGFRLAVLPRRSRPGSPGSPPASSASARASARSTSRRTPRGSRSSVSRRGRSSPRSMLRSRPAGSPAPGSAPSQPRAAIGPRAHFAVVTAALALVAVALVRFLLPPDADDQAQGPTFVRPPRSILVLGAAAFCTMLAEGAAADWSAVYLSRSFAAAAGVAALAYTVFALAMTASRTFGDRLNRRYGPATLARSGACSRPRASAPGSPSARCRSRSPASRRWARASASSCRSCSAPPRRRRASRRASALPPSRRSAGSGSSPVRRRSASRRPPSACAQRSGSWCSRRSRWRCSRASAGPGRRTAEAKVAAGTLDCARSGA